jgi:hypothetical protein
MCWRGRAFRLARAWEIDALSRSRLWRNIAEGAAEKAERKPEVGEQTVSTPRPLAICWRQETTNGAVPRSRVLRIQTPTMSLHSFDTLQEALLYELFRSPGRSSADEVFFPPEGALTALGRPADRKCSVVAYVCAEWTSKNLLDDL